MSLILFDSTYQDKKIKMNQNHSSMEEIMTGKKNQEKMKIYNEIIDLLVCIFVSCSCLVAYRKGE